MKLPSFRVWATAIVAGTALAALVLPAARSQILANPSYLPIGVASSGGSTTAWFHDPSSGRALACQTVATTSGGLSGIQCVTARLPQQNAP